MTDTHSVLCVFIFVLSWTPRLLHFSIMTLQLFFTVAKSTRKAGERNWETFCIVDEWIENFFDKLQGQCFMYVPMKCPVTTVPFHGCKCDPIHVVAVVTVIAVVAVVSVIAVWAVVSVVAVVAVEAVVGSKSSKCSSCSSVSKCSGVAVVSGSKSLFVCFCVLPC